MDRMGTDSGELVLFCAGQSLLAQVGRWAAGKPGACMRLASSGRASAVRAATAGASAVIIDATDRPGSAADILRHCLVTTPSERVAVYSEVAHCGLEVYARVRGVLYVLGPMTGEEWEGVFAGCGALVRCDRVGREAHRRAAQTQRAAAAPRRPAQRHRPARPRQADEGSRANGRPSTRRNGGTHDDGDAETAER